MTPTYVVSSRTVATEWRNHGRFADQIVPRCDHIPRRVRKEEHGRFGWDAPEDEEVHSYVDQLASSVGTYL